ncbi:MAG: hypothetical protein ACRDWS_16055 [Acidimicrobiia bacterium]
MANRIPDFDRSRPIEEWSDEEVVDEYRYIKGELADEDPEYRDAEDAPADIIEEEMKRRRLQPDREDVIPDASSPGREENQPAP